jgi:hypothetical protein
MHVHVQGVPKVFTLLDIYVLPKEGKDFWYTLYMYMPFHSTLIAADITII